MIKQGMGRHVDDSTCGKQVLLSAPGPIACGCMLEDCEIARPLSAQQLTVMYNEESESELNEKDSVLYFMHDMILMWSE